jgi:hypothetical protein
MRTLAGFVLAFSVVQSVIFLMASYHALLVIGYAGFACLVIGGVARHYYENGLNLPD